MFSGEACLFSKDEPLSANVFASATIKSGERAESSGWRLYG